MFEEKNTYYFDYSGESNTDQLLELVKNYCLKTETKTVVIGSETGRSAIKALEIFDGTNVQLVVVSGPSETQKGPKGDIITGLKHEKYREIVKKLEDTGVKIVQCSRPFAPPTRALNRDVTFEGILTKTLEVFSQGTKISIEAALMATDAGALKEGEEVITCAGTFKGLDTALLVRTTNSMNFFSDFDVREILAKPCRRVKKWPEYDQKDWKGDLDKYY